MQVAAGNEAPHDATRTRRRANVRLAVALGLVAVGFYMLMVFVILR